MNGNGMIFLILFIILMGFLVYTIMHSNKIKTLMKKIDKIVDEKKPRFFEKDE